MGNTLAKHFHYFMHTHADRDLKATVISWGVIWDFNTCRNSTPTYSVFLCNYFLSSFWGLPQFYFYGRKSLIDWSTHFSMLTICPEGSCLLSVFMQRATESRSWLTFKSNDSTGPPIQIKKHKLVSDQDVMNQPGSQSGLILEDFLKTKCEKYSLTH